MSIAAFARRGLAAALLLPAVLAGCSVSSPPRLYASLHPAPIPAKVRIDSPATPAAHRFSAALLHELAAQGIHVLPEADTVITVTVSERPATMGIAQESTARPDVQWLWQPRRKSLFDPCSVQTMDVNVVAKSNRVAQPYFTGRGAFTYCSLKPEGLDTLARAFAAAMTGQ